MPTCPTCRTPYSAETSVCPTDGTSLVGDPAAAQLAIVNPLAGARGMGFLKLFSTHPPTAERVARLQALENHPDIALRA